MITEINEVETTEKHIEPTKQNFFFVQVITNLHQNQEKSCFKVIQLGSKMVRLQQIPIKSRNHYEIYQKLHSIKAKKI